ncbi:hypothetical protein Tco_1243784 [Tanacetum coccineum]
MSESSIGNFKGKKIMKEEEPNDEWINPTSDDNIILGNYVKKCLSDGLICQEILEGNAFDPWIPTLEQGEQRSMESMYNGIYSFFYKDINLPIKDQDPAFLI